MYKFLLEQEKDVKPDLDLGNKLDAIKSMKNLLEVDKINIEIVTKGLKDECPLCKKVLELFITIFAETAGILLFIAYLLVECIWKVVFL